MIIPKKIYNITRKKIVLYTAEKVSSYFNKREGYLYNIPSSKIVEIGKKMIIDAHTHLFPPTVAKERELFFDDHSFKLLYSDTKSTIADFTVTTEYCKHSHIDQIVALSFPWNSIHRCTIHNEYLLKLANRRITPFASVPSKPTKEITSLIREITCNGFIGVGELAFYTSDFDDALWSYINTIFSLCEEEGLIVSLHINDPVGHNYCGKYSTPFEKLYNAIVAHPHLTVILAHFGGGILFYELMPEVKEKFGNILYDTAAAPYLYSPEIYRRAIDIVGSKKIVFGTDFPLLQETRYLEAIESNHKQSALTVEEQNDILYANCANLL